MRLTIEGLVKRCENDAEMTNDLLTVKDLASRIDRDISFMTWQLRPTELEMLGLREALKSFVEEWSSHSSIDAEFEFVGEDGPLPQLVDTNVYRIVQEALNNIAKHAGAEKVSILMHRQRTHIFVIVEDDGKGFDPNAAGPVRTDGHGHGLIGMRERAELLGGTLSIESTEGRGTSIIVRVPLGSEGNGNGRRPTRF